MTSACFADFSEPKNNDSFIEDVEELNVSCFYHLEESFSFLSESMFISCFHTFFDILDV